MGIFLQVPPMDMSGAGVGADLGFYKFMFLGALLLISIISVFLILGLQKAKKDEETRVSLQEKQTKLMEEILVVLKDIKGAKSGSANNAVSAPENKS